MKAINLRMTYIRIKKIQKQEYAYLVESINTERGPRQKVKQYLGKVHHLILPEFIPSEKSENTKKEFLNQLIGNHLKALNFNQTNSEIENEHIVISLENYSMQNKKSQKDIVLSLNPGFLCQFTIQRILNFKKTTDLRKDGYTLANYIKEAGLQITEKEFVQFYQLL